MYVLVMLSLTATGISVAHPLIFPSEEVCMRVRKEVVMDASPRTFLFCLPLIREEKLEKGEGNGV